MNDGYILLQKVLEKKKCKKISEFLFVSEGTVKRWIKKEKVPSQYKIDLMRLLGEKVDYKKFTSQEKDQFFTSEKTAKYCYDIFKKVMKNKNVDINEYIFIEPSAGDGVFLNVLPKETIALDIEPRHVKIKKQNFLVWEPENKTIKYIGFGNPPFGLRGNLAARFINHFSKFADFVCFILPQLFESDGKGSPRKRIKEYNLIYSEILEDSNFYYPEKKEEYADSMVATVHSWLLPQIASPQVAEASSMGDDLLPKSVVIIISVSLVAFGRVIVALLVELDYFSSSIEAFVSSF